MKSPSLVSVWGDSTIEISAEREGLRLTTQLLDDQSPWWVSQVAHQSRATGGQEAPQTQLARDHPLRLLVSSPMLILAGSTSHAPYRPTFQTLAEGDQQDMKTKLTRGLAIDLSRSMA